MPKQKIEPEQKITVENRRLEKIMDWVLGICFIVFLFSIVYTWRTPSNEGEVFFISLGVLFSACLWDHCPYLRRDQKYIFYFIVLSTIVIIGLPVLYVLLDNPLFGLIWLFVVPIIIITLQRWSKIDMTEILVHKITRLLIEGFSKQRRKLEKKN